MDGALGIFLIFALAILICNTLFVAAVGFALYKLIVAACSNCDKHSSQIARRKRAPARATNAVEMELMVSIDADDHNFPEVKGEKSSTTDGAR